MPKRMGCKSLVQMHIVMQSEVTRGIKFSHENWYNHKQQISKSRIFLIKRIWQFVK